jgi:TRAP transporter TAXI family solute receptor
LRRVQTFLSVVLIGLCAAEGARAAGSETARDQAARAWLGLIAGAAAASETMLAADMASLFPTSEQLRVLPMLGDTGAGNLAALLEDPRVDLAFVSTDALAAEVANDKSLSEKLELVARLSPQEVHVLARADIGSVSDLSGRLVNLGPAGSASAATAAALFAALGLKVEASNLDATSAIERLKQGTISAMVLVGGKPSPLISAIPANAGIHLLPISFGPSLETAYLPTRLEAGDYPNLIKAGSEVATVATGMVLLAARSKADPGSPERVARFVGAVFPRFAELQAQGRHPKWREVNLAASLPGFKRNRAAEAWLAGQPVEAARPMAARANAGQAPGLPDSLVMSEQQKEALFKRFIEWQRGKGP